MKTRCQHIGLNNPKPFLDSHAALSLRQAVDKFIDKKIVEWQSTVPYAKHFEEATIHVDYYRRHLIETILRIRLLRVAESQALAEIAKISPLAAQIWANYEREEMVHDELFLKDLQKTGVDKKAVLETEPYLATKLLVGYFYYLLAHEGPLGVVAYSYLVEYVNVKLEPEKLKALRTSLGEHNIKGQLAHAHTDTEDDHPGEVWQALRYLIKDEQDICNLYHYLAEMQTILAQYFNEVYNDVVAQQTKKVA